MNKLEPFRTKLKLTAAQTKRLIDKVLFEYRGILDEKKEHDSGLQENHSVDERIKEGNKAYEGKVDYTNIPWDGCANTAGIIIPAAVDGARAQIMKAFNEDPPFRAINDDNPDTIREKEMFFQSLFRDKIPDAESEITSWVDSGTLHGFGLLKHYFKTTYKTARPRITYNTPEEFLAVHNENDNPAVLKKLRKGIPVKLVESEDLIDYSGEIVEWVDSKDFLIRRKYKNTNSAPFVGDKKYYTGEELLLEDFDNLDELIPAKNRDKTSTENDPFLTIHCEVMFDKNLDGKPEKVFCVIEESKEILLLAEKFPYDHGHSIYIPIFINSFRGSFWRLGFFDKLRSIHFTHKDIVDIILNSAYITFIPSFKAQKNTDFDPREQDWYPGCVTYLDDVNSVVQWDIRPSQMPFSEWADRMQQYGYEMSGISPYNQGAPTSAGESGRKIGLLLAAGGMRMEEVIKTLNRGFKELIYQSVELIKQMSRTNQLHSEGEPINVPQVIFASKGSSYMSAIDINRMAPEAVLEKDMMIANMQMDNPLVQQNPDAISEINKKVLRSAGADWSKLAETILPTQEELQRQKVETVKQALKEMAMEKSIDALAGEMGQNDAIPAGGQL